MRDFLAQSGLKAAARSVLVDVILGLCAAGLILIGSGFLLLTGYGALTRELGPLWAAGLMAAGMFVLAAVILIILRSRHQNPAAVPTATVRTTASVPLTTPPPAAADPAVMAVFVLGFVLARHFLPPR